MRPVLSCIYIYMAASHLLRCTPWSHKIRAHKFYNFGIFCLRVLISTLCASTAMPSIASSPYTLAKHCQLPFNRKQLFTMAFNNWSNAVSWMPLTCGGHQTLLRLLLKRVGQEQGVRGFAGAGCTVVQVARSNP